MLAVLLDVLRFGQNGPFCPFSTKAIEANLPSTKGSQSVEAQRKRLARSPRLHSKSTCIIPGNSTLIIHHFFQYGDTPLHTAARYGHAGVARILLSAAANVDLQNKVSGSEAAIKQLGKHSSKGNVETVCRWACSRHFLFAG